MMNPKAISFHLEVSGMVIPCPHISFNYARRVWMGLFNMRSMVDKLRDFLFAALVQRFLIYFLQMIVSFFARLRWRMWEPSKSFWIFMRRLQVKRLTLQKPPCSLVKMCWIPLKRLLKICWGLLRLKVGYGFICMEKFSSFYKLNRKKWPLENGGW